ncbi:MAG: hypothetical protein P8172_11910 [Gammaproteobacteria bacterium]
MEIDSDLPATPQSLTEAIATVWLEAGRIVATHGPAAAFLGTQAELEGRHLAAAMSDGVVPADVIEEAVAVTESAGSHRPGDTSS